MAALAVITVDNLLATDECQFCGETFVASEDTDSMAMLMQHYMDEHEDILEHFEEYLAELREENDNGE